MAPTSPLPEGFRLRACEEDDLAVAAALVRAEEDDVRGRSEWGPQEMIDFWRHGDFDAGSWIAETADGHPAGFAVSMHRDDATDCWVTVHPEFRARGLSSLLLEQVELGARARRSRTLKAGMLAENEAARALFDRLGFRESRHFFHMRIVFDGPPSPPHWPEGIELAPFRRKDARAFHAALGEAFEDEWSFVALPFDTWERTRLDVPETDTSLWFVARDGDEIAGVNRCDPKKHGGGWIGALGVRKQWRQRGIGLALLRQAFVEFHRRGELHVGLGVDADNPTGATRLYEAAGMRVLTEDILFERDLA
ncbi:MAG TPA: GNAT family N-acetyltransferase [Gaiellaceae bacterium]